MRSRSTDNLKNPRSSAARAAAPKFPPPFTSAASILRAGYWKGQRVEVTFPYSPSSASSTPGQNAEVVRVTEDGNGHYSVAVHFSQAKLAGPRAENGNRAGASAGSAVVANAPQSVVLGVESDPKTAEIMRTILSNDGYTVIIVPTAQQALDVLRTTVPSVFIAEVEGRRTKSAA